VLDGVRDAISVQRLRSYLRVCGGELAAALELYRWNHDIAGSLLRPLCDLEVTLRNALVRELEALASPAPWWSMPALRADEKCHINIKRATRTLLRAGKDQTSDAMVAEMPFGFWVALTDSGFDMSLWRRGLYRAFRHYRGPRKPLHFDLQCMLKLRNRIGHHEPIHHRHLEADRRTIDRLLGYLSHDMQQWGNCDDGFLKLLLCRPVEADIPASPSIVISGTYSAAGRRLARLIGSTKQV
jgi:hypothetical protein